MAHARYENGNEPHQENTDDSNTDRLGGEMRGRGGVEECSD